MNPEKYFLGFPISTHVSSLGYKKAEAANLQQSCVLTCSTIQCDDCKRQSLRYEATVRECILLSRPRGSSFSPRTAVAAWLWRWCLWECLHCQLRERGCWNPRAPRHSASGWQSSGATFVDRGVSIRTNCKYAIDVLHMICFLVLFSRSCCFHTHADQSNLSPDLTFISQAADLDTRRRLLSLVPSDFLGSLFQLSGCSSSWVRVQMKVTKKILKCCTLHPVTKTKGPTGKRAKGGGGTWVDPSHPQSKLTYSPIRSKRGLSRFYIDDSNFQQG